MSAATLAAALMLLPAPRAQCATEWELRISDAASDIRVHYRINEKGYTEFRAVTRVRSRLGAFVALFGDVDVMPRWVYRVKEVTKLHVVSDAEVYSRTITEMPWPFSDRDAIVHSVLKQDPITLAVSIEGRGVPDFLPESERYVRMPVVESYWRFTPLPGGMVEVVFQGYGDPGGAFAAVVPDWLTRLVLWEAPYHTLRGLRETVQRDEYQLKTFDYVREPGR